MNDFIEIYDNSVPLDLCDELVNWFDICSERNFTSHNMKFLDGKTQIGRRSDEQISFPLTFVSSYSISTEICNAFWEVLGKCVNDYVEKYDLSLMDLSVYSFKLQKVKKGQGYHVWHCENDGHPVTNRRALAWMTYLKVPEEGGETEFLHQSRRIEPVIGRTLIWPAYFTHLHRGNPPLKGEKYYITGWFERD